ncbi:MAG: hypothetical protein FJ319_00550 [SAR202 cluster bacterium]|nr:hypothetical protein [SAR202 cluster bacterium]
MEDQETTALLAEYGFTGEAAAAALAAMIEASLTNPRKSRIQLSKAPKIEALLSERFVLVCGRDKCREAAEAALRAGAAAWGQSQAGAPKTIVVGAREFCSVCGGSENARAVREMAEAMARAGKSRLIIIGGTPEMKTKLTSLLPQAVEARFVFAGDYTDTKRADANANWADIIVVWSSTPIPHKQTVPYRAYRPITVARRGIAALADGVVRSLS